MGWNREKGGTWSMNMLEVWCSSENARETCNMALNAESSPRPCVLPPTPLSRFLDNRTYDSGSSIPRAISPERRIADIWDKQRHPSCKEPSVFLSSCSSPSTGFHGTLSGKMAQETVGLQ